MALSNQLAGTSAFHIQLKTNAAAAYRRELQSLVSDALGRGQRRIIVDCTSWAQLDLILLSALVSCAELCDEQGADFELENLPVETRTRIEALRLDNRFGPRE